jgi:hypothetical protein
MKRLIKSKFADRGYKEKLDNYSELLFCFLYVDTSTQQGFKTYENNYSTIDLRQYFAGYLDYFNKKYYCINRGTNVNYPIVSFIDLSSFLDFAITKVQGLIQTTTQAATLSEYLAELYVVRYPIPRNTNVWTEMTSTDKAALIDKFKKAIEVYTSII